MSEQILERPGPATTSQPEPPRRSHRTFLVVAAAIIAGLVLGGVALVVLEPGGGDDPDLVGAAQGSSAATGSSAAQAAAPSASPSVRPARASSARISSRDPFAPLIAKPKPAPTPKAVVPKASAGTSSASPATAPSPTAELRPASGGTISVLSISPLGDSLTLKLDGKKYTVDEGETFAEDYRLYDIFNADCAGFLYGDQNAVACKGDQVAVG